MKDFLRSLEAKGDPTWIQEWEKAHWNGQHDTKKAILERLKMALDEKSVLTVSHNVTSGRQTETNQVRGWMALWEVADVEKIPFKLDNASLLRDVVANDQSKPHPNESLAKKGWRVYYHVKNEHEKEKLYNQEKWDVGNHRDDVDEEDYNSAMLAIRAERRRTGSAAEKWGGQ